MNEMFTKNFLDQLNEISDQFTIIDYIMKSENLSFHDSILKLSKFCELKPEYIVHRERSKREDVFEVAQEKEKIVSTPHYGFINERGSLTLNPLYVEKPYKNDAVL